MKYEKKKRGYERKSPKQDLTSAKGRTYKTPSGSSLDIYNRHVERLCIVQMMKSGRLYESLKSKFK